MAYPWFFLFVDMWATTSRLPLGQILSHATCDVYAAKAVERLINLMSDTDFRARQKLYFFTRNLAANIYIFILV